MKEKYLRMLKKMEENNREQPAEWSVYILLCRDNSLYTGIAKDVSARFEQHCKGKGAAYTRSHPPVKILHTENGLTRSQALIREAAIKRLPKQKKLVLPAPGTLSTKQKKLCKTKKNNTRRAGKSTTLAAKLLPK